MSTLQRLDKSFPKLLALLMLIYGVAMSSAAEIKEIFEEEEELQMPPAVVANHFSIPHVQAPAHDNGICHVEYTVLKKSVGHCVKIGKSMRACISGAYFHPYHPDCIV
jgi:hypothetical protein